MKNLLSIIIPAYKTEKVITRTLDSLVKQTNDCFEIVIINDGSPDNTVNVINDFFVNYPDVSYLLFSKENGGVSSARNVGIQKAKGTFLYFLDSDDTVASDFVDKIMTQIDRQPSDIIAFGFDRVDEKGNIKADYDQIYDLKAETLSPDQALIQLLAYQRRKQIWTGSAVYRREFVLDHQLFFTQGCVNGEDQEFIFKAIARAEEVTFIPYTLSYYCDRSDSISNSFNIKKFQVVDAFERVKQDINLQPIENKNKILNLLQQKQTQNYLFAYHSCFSALTSSYSRFKAHQILRQNLDQSFPNLSKRMKQQMKNLSNLSLNLKIKYRLFRINPALYCFLVDKILSRK